jgi:hypothetical protein
MQHEASWLYWFSPTIKAALLAPVDIDIDMFIAILIDGCPLRRGLNLLIACNPLEEDTICIIPCI